MPTNRLDELDPTIEVWTQMVVEDVKIYKSKRYRAKWWILRHIFRKHEPGFSMPMVRFVNVDDPTVATPLFNLDGWYFGPIDLRRPLVVANWSCQIINPNPYHVSLTLHLMGRKLEIGDPVPI